MYLLQYDNEGKIDTIVPNPERGLGGIYVSDIPVSIEKLLQAGLIEQLIDLDNKIYYKLK